MCEQNAYLMREGEKELVMEAVTKVEAGDDSVTLVSVFGEQKVLPARIHALALNEGEIILRDV